MVPPAHAGAIAACLDKDRGLTQVCALMNYAKIAAVAVVAVKISKNLTDSQSNQSYNPVNAEQKLALHTPMPSEPEQLKVVFEQRINKFLKDSTKFLVAGPTAAKACSCWQKLRC